MQFQVPQFIDIEDKIFGPLTFKQFIYLAGGGGILFVLYKTLPFFFTILLGVPLAIFALLLAFYKINNKPFIYIVEAYISYMFQSKLYIWKKEVKKNETKEVVPGAKPSIPLPKLSDSKLKDLAWSLDILDPTKK